MGGTHHIKSRPSKQSAKCTLNKNLVIKSKSTSTLSTKTLLIVLINLVILSTANTANVNFPLLKTLDKLNLKLPVYLKIEAFPGTSNTNTNTNVNPSATQIGAVTNISLNSNNFETVGNSYQYQEFIIPNPNPNPGSIVGGRPVPVPVGPGGSVRPPPVPVDLMPIPDPEPNNSGSSDSDSDNPTTEIENPAISSFSLANQNLLGYGPGPGSGHGISYEGVGANYNPHSYHNSFKNQAPVEAESESEEDENSKDTKFAHYAAYFNITGKPGRRPVNCDCGLRRRGGVSTDSREDEEGGQQSQNIYWPWARRHQNQNRKQPSGFITGARRPGAAGTGRQRTRFARSSRRRWMKTGTGTGTGTGIGTGTGTGTGTESFPTRIHQKHKVVGGRDALVNEFPWRVALQTSSRDNAKIGCGGSIIDKRWILTAAHCFNDINSTTVIYVNAGEHDKSTPIETDNVIIRGSLIYIHPRYDNTTNDNDIALVRLERDLQYRYNIQPICLPFRLEDVDMTGSTVVAGGWGDTEENATTSTNTLQTTDLNLLTTIQCRKFVGADRADTITDNMLCATAPGRDTCQGDSGDTIDYYDIEVGRYIAVGIVSFGEGCARPGEPGVYTKIVNYLDFIRSTTGGAVFCIK